jgi:putative hydrolase of the HAD superfamily
MGVLLFKRADYQPDALVDEIDHFIGKVTDDSAFKTEVLEKYNLSDIGFEEILDKIVGKYEKFEPLWQMLPDLRKHYKLAIINNGTALTLKKFNIIHKIDKNFDLFVSSALEGIRKPDAEIFLRTARKLEVDLQNCLFMDDSEININGAKGVGMKTIWWPQKETGFEEFLGFIKR